MAIIVNLWSVQKKYENFVPGMMPLLLFSDFLCSFILAAAILCNLFLYNIFRFFKEGTFILFQALK
jgi:hypothetical protein